MLGNRDNNDIQGNKSVLLGHNLLVYDHNTLHLHLDAMQCFNTKNVNTDVVNTIKCGTTQVMPK